MGFWIITKRFGEFQCLGELGSVNIIKVICNITEAMRNTPCPLMVAGFCLYINNEGMVNETGEKLKLGKRNPVHCAVRPLLASSNSILLPAFGFPQNFK